MDVLGCRIVRKLGRILLPRQLMSELLSLTAWFTVPSPGGRTQLQTQMVGGRWVRALQPRRETRCVVSEFLRWITTHAHRWH